MNRIVSLLPSSTEIICALGCGERLVGRSHECDYPAGIGDFTCLHGSQIRSGWDLVSD